ncbi:MAG TPA: anaerobic ribonucleoside-triphosphate reductase activating protein [Candidatus Bathyarchaeia archaeon]|nr:anaerobic ribonucleoside-triphosphate reductase activating protein [Candidatus Bathyarchaeia archaeon]
MEIKGFIDVSLSDWDGKVSSVIFLPECNFRCPFCYNKRLVLQPQTMSTIALERVEKHIQANKKWIDGVVITGGEPTRHEELPSLCNRLKAMGYCVKVDTNGTNPFMLRDLVDRQLINYVALDVKSPLTEKDYSLAAGVKAASFLEKITETIEFLLAGNVDYEFRTTLVPTLVETESVDRICQTIKGCRKYMLQNFKSDVETLDPRFQALRPFSTAQMESFLRAAKKAVPTACLRG